MKVPDSKAVIEAIRQKLEKQKNQGKQNENSKYRWSPKAGEENKVRILPYPHGISPEPFIELYFHYNLPGKPMCPKLSFPEREERCAICEFSEDLLKEAKEAKAGGNKNNSAWEQYKNIAANNRAFCFVIIRGREQEGPKCWGISQQNYNTIQHWFIDPEFGDLSDTLEGIDLTLITTQEKNKKYPNTAVSAARNNSRLFPSTNDKKADNLKVAQLIASIPKIEEVYPITTYEETEKILRDSFPKTDEEEIEIEKKVDEIEEATSQEDEVIEKETSKEENNTEESIDDLLAQLNKKK